MLIYSGVKSSKQSFGKKVKAVTIKDAYLANLLNSKAIILYLVVVTSFASVNPTLFDFLFLSTIHIIMMALWLVLSCGLLILTSTKVDIVKLKKVINIGGGILLLIMTITPYLTTGPF